MPRNPTLRLNLFLLFIGIGLIVVGIFLVSSNVAVAQESGDMVRGGLLYDTWWVVEDADIEMEGGEEPEHGLDEMAAAPEGDHPLWSTQTTNTRSGADTWRCKECHGWDYKGADGAYGSGSHLTGFPGVFANAGQPVADIVAALSGSINADHDFSMYMDKDSLLDLATFISEALIDTSTLLNTDNMSAGDTANGEVLFEQVCVFCHGPAGNAINFSSLDDPEFIGHLAADNPWEFIHKVRFGQPGWPMPSGIGNGWSDSDVADVLAYVEGFTTEPALSGGGPLYDKWWEALGMEAPEGDHPLWASQDTNTRSGTDTWRCKECHGWDYKGTDGVYGSGSHFTGFPNVLGTEDVLAWLNGSMNPEHDFSIYMDETALNALVTFLQTEIADVSMYINDDKTVNGDPRFGRDLFTGTCASCHGVDGRHMNFGSEEEPEYIGTLAVDNPWEFIHKASFGQPGEPMPAGLALGWELQDIADLLAYAQTLPAD